MRSAPFPLLATKRSVVVMVGAMLIALVLVLAIGVASKKADAATQVVTKTFRDTGQILIPAGAVVGNCGAGPTVGAADAYPSEILVHFPQGSRLLDANIRLKNYTHTVPDDVDVLLVHKGVNRTIMSDGGGDHSVKSITLTLDDEASTALPNQGQIVSGSFKPTNKERVETSDRFPAPAPSLEDTRAALSGFDGQNPNGTWSLFVTDDSGADCGEFGGGWSIRIMAKVPV
jgi:hypothetical protein